MRFLYPGYKYKALTFSYDDACTQDRRLTALFRQYGVLATFNVNSGDLGTKNWLDHGGFHVRFDRVTEEEFADLYRGFEVACHGSHHVGLTSNDRNRAEGDLAADVAKITRLTGITPRGYAYAGGPYDYRCPGILRRYGLCYGRTVEDTHDFSLPQIFELWHPTCHDRDDALPGLVRRFTDSRLEEMQLLYIWGHSFELDKDDVDRWGNLERRLEELSGREDVWYATNLQIRDYVMATRACTFDGEQLHNPTNRTIYYEHNGEMLTIEPQK